MLHALDKASGGKVEIISAGHSCRMSGDHTTMVSPNPNAPDAFMYGIWKPMDSVLFSANFNMVGNHADIVKVVQLYPLRSEEHTSELQSLMRISYAVFCMKKKTINKIIQKV